jgi:hypothetical protein
MADDATPIRQSDISPAHAFTGGGQVSLGDQVYMPDTRGALVPIESVKAVDKLIDAEVRKIMGFAQDLSDQIGRFKQHTLEDFTALAELLDQEYGAGRGGVKGNMTFTSFDGTLKVQLQIAERISFGPELQSAKKLVDECLNDWAGEARPELRAIVNQAFNVDKEGQVNRAEMFRLQRLDIEDSRWKRAMDAVRDSIRVIGAKEYVRFYRRPNAKAPWVAVPIDVAGV